MVCFVHSGESGQQLLKDNIFIVVIMHPFKMLHPFKNVGNLRPLSNY